MFSKIQLSIGLNSCEDSQTSRYEMHLDFLVQWHAPLSLFTVISQINIWNTLRFTGKESFLFLKLFLIFIVKYSPLMNHGGSHIINMHKHVTQPIISVIILPPIVCVVGVYRMIVMYYCKLWNNHCFQSMAVSMAQWWLNLGCDLITSRDGWENSARSIEV